MFVRGCTVCLFLAAAGLALADGGSITGKVSLKGGQGAAAAREVVKMDANAACMKIHDGKKVGTETEIVGKTGEIKNVLVSIKSGLPAGKKYDAPAAAVKLDQKGCMYAPHVFGIMVNQKLEIVNSDPTNHNVHGVPTKNEDFNKPQNAGSETITKQFPKAEDPFLVKCDVHPWMSAYCGVFEHPFFSVSEKDGTFTLKDVPPGDYTVQFWHEVYGVKEAKVTVKAGEAAKADIELEPAKK